MSSKEFTKIAVIKTANVLYRNVHLKHRGLSTLIDDE